MDENIVVEKLKQLRNLQIKKTSVFEQGKDLDTNTNDAVRTIEKIQRSLKELKETTIHMKQKLDMLTSERNVMEVEFSQVTHFYFKLLFYEFLSH